MKAAIVSKSGDLIVKNVSKFKPDLNEVCVKVQACGICGSDVHAFMAGAFSEGTIPGHEFSGEISELGSDVRYWSVGDRVVVIPAMYCGKCYWCRSGFRSQCPTAWVNDIGGGRPGAFAEFVNVPLESLRKLPDSLTFNEGALVEPLAVGLHAMTMSGFRIGESALVFGTGPIGLIVVTCLKLAGAQRIIAAEISALRREMALSMGADKIIKNATPKEIRNAFSHDDLIDHVFLCSESEEGLNFAIESVKRGGRITIMAGRRVPVKFNVRQLFLKELNIHTSLGYADEFDKAIQFLKNKRLDINTIVTEVISLDKINDAFKRLANPEDSIKILVRPHEDN